MPEEMMDSTWPPLMTFTAIAAQDAEAIVNHCMIVLSENESVKIRRLRVSSEANEKLF